MKINKISLLKPETIADIAQYCNNYANLINAFKELKRVTIDVALEGELGHHLGFAKSERSANANSRNGFGIKTITTDHETLTIETPRDREASF